MNNTIDIITYILMIDTGVINKRELLFKIFCIMIKYIGGNVRNIRPNLILIIAIIFINISFKFIFIYTIIVLFSESSMRFFLLILLFIIVFADFFLFIHITYNIIFCISVIFRSISRYLKYVINVITVNHIVWTIILSVYLGINMIK